MYISVQFKDRNKVFKGKTYDYKLDEKEKIPKKGAIVRMFDEDNEFVAYGTRVKVVDVKTVSLSANENLKVRLLETTLDN